MLCRLKPCLKEPEMESLPGFASLNAPELPVRHTRPSLGRRLASFGCGLLTVRNAFAAVLGTCSAALFWTGIETAAALSTRVDEDSPDTAVAAGLVVGTTAGTLSFLLGIAAVRVAEILPPTTSHPVSFVTSAAAGAIVGGVGGALSAYFRWSEIRDAIAAAIVTTAMPDTLSMAQNFSDDASTAPSSNSLG
jgi:hypothetical protein